MRTQHQIDLRKPVTIGRDPAKADVVIADSYVSGRHCSVEMDANGYRVTDLNSTNGTYVGGVRLPKGASRVLSESETFRVSRAVFICRGGFLEQVGEEPGRNDTRDPQSKANQSAQQELELLVPAPEPLKQVDAGQVRVVRDASGRQSAHKCLHASLHRPDVLQGIRERLQSYQSLLTHEGLVPYLSVEVIASPHAVSSPYITGTRSLAQMLQDDPSPRPVDRVVDFVRKAAQALAPAHAAGIAHRDIRLNTVLLDEEGRVYLLGFGLTGAIREVLAGRMETPLPFGSPLYMAPEAGWGQDTQPVADVYALATIAYQLLAGYPPYIAANSSDLARLRAQPPVQLRAAGMAVPAHVADAIAKGLSNDPISRFQNAGEFAAALASPRRALRTLFRRDLLNWAALVLVLGLLGYGIFAPQPKPPPTELGQLLGRMQDLIGQVKDLTTQVANGNQSLGKALEQLRPIQQQVRGLKTAVMANQIQLAALKRESGGIRKALQGINGGLSGIHGEIQRVQKKIDDTESLAKQLASEHPEEAKQKQIQFGELNDYKNTLSEMEKDGSDITQSQEAGQ